MRRVVFRALRAQTPNYRFKATAYGRALTFALAGLWRSTIQAGGVYTVWVPSTPRAMRALVRRCSAVCACSMHASASALSALA